MKHFKFDAFNFCLKRWVKPVPKAQYVAIDETYSFDTTCDIRACSVTTYDMNCSFGPTFDIMRRAMKSNLCVTTESVPIISENIDVNDCVHITMESIPPYPDIMHISADDYNFLKADYESTHAVGSSLVNIISNQNPGSPINLVYLNRSEWGTFVTSRRKY